MRTRFRRHRAGRFELTGPSYFSNLRPEDPRVGEYWKRILYSVLSVGLTPRESQL